MLSERSFIISDRNTCSEKVFNTHNGLPQGMVTSPLLFSLYISSLLEQFNYSHDSTIQIVAYADDLITYVGDKKATDIQNTLQNMFDQVILYAKYWRMEINFSKCEVILF
jgi:hypothetical protein